MGEQACTLPKHDSFILTELWVCKFHISYSYPILVPVDHAVRNALSVNFQLVVVDQFSDFCVQLCNLQLEASSLGLVLRLLHLLLKLMETGFCLVDAVHISDIGDQLF